MFNILIDTNFLDDLFKPLGMSAEEYCKKMNFDYNQFMRVYNNDLSLTLRELNKFLMEFNITTDDLLLI